MFVCLFLVGLGAMGDSAFAHSGGHRVQVQPVQLVASKMAPAVAKLVAVDSQSQENGAGVHGPGSNVCPSSVCMTAILVADSDLEIYLDHPAAAHAGEPQTFKAGLTVGIFRPPRI